MSKPENKTVACLSAWLPVHALVLGVGLTASVLVSTAGELPQGEIAAVTAEARRISSADELNAKWGIQVVALRVSAQGNIIDFRYRVTDSDKASALGNPKSKPTLTDKMTGKTLHVPNTKAGQMRSTGQRLAAGKTYTALFANPGKVVKPGNKVSIVIGDFRADDLTVRE